MRVLCPLSKSKLYVIIMAASLFGTFLIPAKAVQVAEPESHIHDHTIAYQSPRSQFLANVQINMIDCAKGFELIMKKTNGMPACVRPATIPILIERGWGIHVMPSYEDKDNNSDMLVAESAKYSVTAESVVYFDNYTGYLAAPDAKGQDFPGLVIIHEWWGLNDNMKEMTEELASHGYVVLAVNLFGKEAATTPDEARQQISLYDPEVGVANMNGAVDYLEANYGVTRVGSIGWCFGGGQSLNLALRNSDMDATVIYYGSITSDREKLASISWPVLGIFAGLDQGIPVESVKEFEKSLVDLGIKNEIHIYPNANHGFANPSGQQYAPEETKDAWQKTIRFLHDNLQL